MAWIEAHVVRDADPAATRDILHARPLHAFRIPGMVARGFGLRVDDEIATGQLERQRRR